MSYEIHLSFNNNEEGFQIPVNPETIELTASGNGKTYDIIGPNGGTNETRAGEINVITSPKLREVSFSGIFPAKWYPFVTSEKLYEPMYYVKLIEKWMATKHPIRFVYGAHYEQHLVEQYFRGQDINFPASIEKFSWKEDAGSSGDLEYSLSLKEYVFYSARRVVVKTDSNGESVAISQQKRRPDDRIRPETYMLKDGETLLDVSKKFYETSNGDPDSSRYLDIQELNKLSDADVRKLKAGTLLKLPAH
ncbi:LysM peptidoglycan-binding domain-containing protein [Paenibacillus ferrarius]|uniref:LysM peptidoglycan-binding domain-containing protein n=1 Tax=Paenibacillus ferrarius TaxID=1469647 RepID=UPI003D26B5D2